MVSHDSGFCPIAIRPVKPVPNATIRRPGAMCSSGCLRYRMAVARDQHRRANTDVLRALGEAGEMHPNVVAAGGDLRRPDALVTELLRKDCLVERLRARYQAEGVGQRHTHSMRIAARAA